MVTNDPQTAKHIAQKVDFLRASVQRSTRNLGVDFACGSTRRTAAVRKARVDKVRKRILKIRWLRRQGAQVKRLVSGSVLPATLWGTRALAPAWAQLRDCRRQVHSAMVRQPFGRSCTIDLMMSGRPCEKSIGPATRGTVEPITMLAAATRNFIMTFV